MVEFLRKYLSELQAQRLDAVRKLEDIDSKILEKGKLIEFLTSSVNNKSSIFSPRTVNSNDSSKIKEVEEELQDLNFQRSNTEKLVKAFDTRLEEINNLLSNQKNFSNDNMDKSIFLDKLNNAKQYIFVDPQRTLNEINELISLLS